MIEIVLIILTFLCIIGYSLTLKYLPYLLQDIPNARSNHTQPVPRFGGLVFGLIWILGSFAIVSFGLDLKSKLLPDGSLVFIICATGFWLIGLLDDHFSLPAIFRLAVQFLGVFFVLYLGLEFSSEKIAFRILPGIFLILLSTIIFCVVVITLVFCINAFNFMDGSDGLATSEAIFLLFSVIILGYYDFFLLLMAALLVVFLWWNFPKAKIFMGDAGSYILGFLLSVVIFQVVLNDGFIILILPSVFIVDVIVTLFRRFMRGESLLRAHKQHAYQHLVKRFGHLRVFYGLWALNMALLILFWVIKWQNIAIISILGTVTVYMMLIIIAVKLGAGQDQ